MIVYLSRIKTVVIAFLSNIKNFFNKSINWLKSFLFYILYWRCYNAMINNVQYFLDKWSVKISLVIIKFSGDDPFGKEGPVIIDSEHTETTLNSNLTNTSNVTTTTTNGGLSSTGGSNTPPGGGGNVNRFLDWITENFSLEFLAGLLLLLAFLGGLLYYFFNTFDVAGGASANSAIFNNMVAVPLNSRTLQAFYSTYQSIRRILYEMHTSGLVLSPSRRSLLYIPSDLQQVFPIIPSRVPINYYRLIIVGSDSMRNFDYAFWIDLIIDIRRIIFHH